jgi:hypothetical protein
VRVTDSAGNASLILTVPSFVIDTTAPVLAMVTPVPTPSNDTTPSITFSATELGAITYGGSCSSATTATIAGNNTITFNALASGTYSNCTVKVTDGAGNASTVLAMPSFVIDTTAPDLAMVTPVPTPSNDTTPSLTFSSTEAGAIVYEGGCSSATTAGIAGDNAITFNSLVDGSYENCTITVTNGAGNASDALVVNAFTVDTSVPTLAQVTLVPTPTNDATPNYTFSSTEAGTITYGGDCSSASLVAVVGNNMVTFNAMADGVHSNCTIQVKDAANNMSATMAVNNFTIITVTPQPLNDTGITACGDMAYSYTGYTGSGVHNSNVICATAGSTKTTAGTDSDGDAVPAGQDAFYGRDANPATNSDADGYNGFSFTKLGADGTPLADQTQSWSNAKWSCVQDNVTGLIWEVKTDDGGLRDKDWTYSWYNTNSANNGGDWGIGDTGVRTTTGFQSTGGVYYGSDKCFNNARCDTEKYVADVNEATLCGASDWRLPTVHELFSIVANNWIPTTIDLTTFPFTMSNWYWSSSPGADINLAVSAWHVDFDDGSVNSNGKGNSYHVRLVRGSQ